MLISIFRNFVFLNDAYRGGLVLMLILVLVGLFLIDAYRGGVNDAYPPGTRVINYPLLE